MKYYILDTETTGLRSDYNEVVEISIIDYDSKTQLYEKIKALYPERASLDALRITNKTMNDLRSGKSKEDVCNLIVEFLNRDGLDASKRCIVAHNASFDLRFCHKLFDSSGIGFPADYWLDTIQMFKQFCKESQIKSKNNLNDACETLQIKKTGSLHNAKHDSRNTYFLFKKLYDQTNFLKFIKYEPHKKTGLSQEEMEEIFSTIEDEGFSNSSDED